MCAARELLADTRSAAAVGVAVVVILIVFCCVGVVVVNMSATAPDLHVLPARPVDSRTNAATMYIHTYIDT